MAPHLLFARALVCAVALLGLLCVPAAAQTVVFAEDWEGPLGGWQVTNDTGSANNWLVLTGVTGPDGQPTRAAGVPHFHSPPGQYALVSPQFTIPITARLSLEFDLAHAPKPDVVDSLFVIVRFGDESFVVERLGGEELATTSPQNTSFSPTSADQWRPETIDLSLYASRTAATPARIGFISLNGGGSDDRGNNILLDNIVVTALPVTAPLAGREGWRMLSAPVANSSIGDVLGPLRTEGFPGADDETASPNVFAYDESAGAFPAGLTPPSGINEPWGSGTGRLVYAYDGEGPGTLPVTLEADGPGVQLPFSLPASYTAAESADPAAGWNLAGNPFAVSFDWDAALRTNVDHVIYVWDPNASGAGQYRTWNTITGSLETGVLAPFQGFWFKANDAAPAVIATQETRVLGGEFYGRSANDVPRISLHAAAVLESVAFSADAFALLLEGDEAGIEGFSAFELEPLGEDFLQLFGVRPDGVGLNISALPAAEDTLFLPLALDAVRDGEPLSADVTLTWSLTNLDGLWDAHLLDSATGVTVDLATATEYSFTHNPTDARASRPAPSPEPRVASRSTDTRLTLRIARHKVGAEPVPGTARGIRLSAAYPNPFTSNTHLDLTLPADAEVTVAIYDVLGRRLAAPIEAARLDAGEHRIGISGASLAHGVYIVRAYAESPTGTQTVARTVVKMR